MALGARSHWITGPIVLEGLTYTLLGGVAGLLVATILVYLLSLIPTGENMALKALGKPTLSPAIAATAAGVLGIIGLLAGYFPARRAASVEPAETLRYE
jgi:putative ABC transport system permease protein